jgi:hypothetical protein
MFLSGRSFVVIFSFWKSIKKNLPFRFLINKKKDAGFARSRQGLFSVHPLLRSRFTTARAESSAPQLRYAQRPPHGIRHVLERRRRGDGGGGHWVSHHISQLWQLGVSVFFWDVV